MKPPEEIKRGLGYCTSIARVLKGCATICPYWDEKFGCGSDYMMEDALTYIQQLERERDAAVYYIATGKECKTCKHFSHKASDEPCRSCGIGQSRWEWRGVEEDEA